MNIFKHIRTSAFTSSFFVVILLCAFPISGYGKTPKTERSPVSSSPLVVPSPVKEYFITCDKDSFALIYKNFTEDIYIAATVVYQDKTWTNVRLRLRGDSSREFPKKSLKLKFDGEPFANGRSTLNFNAEYLDNSYMHSILSSHLFNKIGYPCFHAEPARIYLNGDFLGLYISIENMDEDFLVGHGLNPKGNLYKAFRDDARLSLHDDVQLLWEKKTNENGSFDDLQQLIQRINTVEDDEYYNFCQQTLDYNKMIDIIAMNMLLSNGSTYYHNYYMYHNPADNKWIMLPWDVDKTFKSYGVGYPYQRGNNPFLQRALMCKPVLSDIQKRVKELSQTFFSPTYLYPIIDSLQTLLLSSIQEDTTDKNTVVDSWYQHLEWEKAYIKDRYQNLGNQFLSHPSVFRIIPTPTIITLPLRLTWTRATDPNNDRLYYSVRTSTSPYFPANSSTHEYNDIADTTFTLTELESLGQYYWTVTVSDRQTSTEGFDKVNSFIHKQGSPLHSPVTGTVTLTAEGSPYTANNDIIIENGAVLKAEPGVRILMPQASNIIVYGSLQLQGSAAAPVTLVPTSDAEFWGSIKFQEPSKPSVLTYTTIVHRNDVSKIAPDITSKIYGLRSTLLLDNVTFTNCYNSVKMENSDFTMKNCSFPTGNIGEHISIIGGTAVIEGCEFARNIASGSAPGGDAIDFDNVPQGAILSNTIWGTTDDGIDIGNSTVTINNNSVFHCADKGISIGEGSKVNASGNVVASCTTGITVKDASQVSVTNATIYNTKYACDAYGNSQVYISNSILSHSTASSLYIQNGSTVQIHYSLSDTEKMDGTGNINASPLFVNPEQNDFHLQAASPCIDAGNPDSPSDPDGTRSDIGAYYFNKVAASTAIVINEISYNQPSDFNTDDWVELFNPSTEAVDISGWVFKDESDDHIFTFPNGTIITANGFVVVCEDTSKFRVLFPTVQPIVGNTGFGLSGSGELIRLFNANGDIVDSLTYDDTDPWPTEADGNGATLELISASLDNALPQSWKASKSNGGTPGQPNSSTNSVGQTIENKLFFLHQNVPNPFSETTTIDYTLLVPAHVEIELYDALGKPVRTLLNTWQSSGTFPLVFNASGLPSGHYFYVLRINGILEHIKSAVIVE